MHRKHCHASDGPCSSSASGRWVKESCLKVNMHALPDFPALPGTAAFMVALRSCQQGCKALPPGGEHGPADTGSRFRPWDMMPYLSSPAYIHIIHDFRDSQHLRQFQKAGNFSPNTAPLFSARGTEGTQEGASANWRRGVFFALFSRSYPFNPSTFCNLMRIHDNGSGPQGGTPSEILRNHHSTFHMKMGSQ